MSDKYILFSLEDEKSRKLGEVISNATCKKIASFLAEKEASASEISRELGIPLNTAEYNISKLAEAGIIEAKKGFFWSSRGKKMEIYKIANKLIVISPKKSSGVYSKLKGILPVVIASGLAAGMIGWIYKTQGAAQSFAKEGADSLLRAVPSAGINKSAYIAGEAIKQINPAIWFIAGAIIAIGVYLIWNWKKV